MGTSAFTLWSAESAVGRGGESTPGGNRARQLSAGERHALLESLHLSPLVLFFIDVMRRRPAPGGYGDDDFWVSV
jgi:hypothetical protein